MAAAAGGAAAGAGGRRLLHGHGVAAVHGGVDDGVDIVDQVLALALGLVVCHHALVAHDLAVEAVHLLVQLSDAGASIDFSSSKDFFIPDLSSTISINSVRVK